MRNGSRLLAACAAATLTASLSAGSATADPTTIPAAQDIVGLGASASQAVLNQFSTDYNAYLSGKGDTTSPRLYSWDATGPSSIVPKDGAAPIARPGSGTAALALLGSTTSATVDFARVGIPSSAPFLYVPFAQDAVSWAAKSGGNAPANLTTAQLKGIYECTITNWAQVDPSSPAATIRPFVPPIDSGSWNLFKSAAGIGALGGCVTSVAVADDGTDPVLNDPNALVPYSVGRYGTQLGGGTGVPGNPGPLTLRAIDGIAPIDPIGGGPNPAFLAGPYTRTYDNAFRDADWTATDAHGQALQAIFGQAGWICTSPVAAADLAGYGYLAVPTCGLVSHS